eukprot:scaffold174_cov98-Cylindrotheca_fusiformis.AAC.10
MEPSTTASTEETTATVYYYYAYEKKNEEDEENQRNDIIPEDASHVRVKESTTEIEEGAFYGYEFLDTVRLHKDVTTIGKQAFYECISLIQITIPFSVTVIEELTFAHCCSLVNVQFHQGLLTIQDRAFMDCISLTNMQLPEGLVTIGEGAFMGCISLSSMTLPDSVREMGAHAWCNCVKLVSIHFPPSTHENDHSGIQRIPTGAFACCTSLRSVWVPPSVKVIQSIAFHNCNNLWSIEIPEGLVEIGGHAFAGCSSLVNIAIPSTVPFVDENAFRACDVLQTRYSNHNKNRSLLTTGLRNKFQDLPLHSLCYYQAYHSNDETVQRLRRLVWELVEVESCNYPLIDDAGMTPLHLLAMSAKANCSLVQTYLNLYPIQSLCRKDAMGYSPLYYLSLNYYQPSRRLMIQMVIREVLSERIQSLRLKQWRLEITNAIDSISDGKDDEDDDDDTNYPLQETMVQQQNRIGQIYGKVAKYEYMEILSCLEQAAWKHKIQDYSSGNITHQQQEKEEDRRQECRIRCGAEIIIPNVIQFLESNNHNNDGDHDEAFSSSWC